MFWMTILAIGLIILRFAFEWLIDWSFAKAGNLFGGVISLFFSRGVSESTIRRARGTSRSRQR
jgi:membrane protein YqaA with SNARE-associated domain